MALAISMLQSAHEIVRLLAADDPLNDLVYRARQ